MTNDTIKRFLAAGFLALSAASLSACNTVEGAGKDIEAAGEEVQEEANENK